MLFLVLEGGDEKATFMMSGGEDGEASKPQVSLS